MSEQIIPSKGSKGQKRLQELQTFAQTLEALSKKIGFKVSARGWCYILENAGVITKPQFESVNGWINDAVKEGFLAVDFVAEDGARNFSGVEIPEERAPIEYFKDMVDSLQNIGKYYGLDWWDGEDYYIQMVVEKVDLKTLFEPVCRKYHIPIANARGWSSILQRATFAKRFKEAEGRGLKCVLLYCGDHDPDGLRISETMRTNLEQISEVFWGDGTEGYDPIDLEIDRFGLNYDFIRKNNLSSIDNLLTGSGKNLASPAHPNHNLDYVQNYLDAYGERKWEANALVTAPEAGMQLCEDAITKYLGIGVTKRFQEKRAKIVERFEKFNEDSGLDDLINDLDDLEDGE